MSDSFGDVLREWRQLRRMSQMELGLSAGVSPRHVSFLETGRARPSRGMVLRLCDELEVPGSARNRWLTSAGLAPAYHSRAGDAPEMAPLIQAVDWMLSRHAPYPAMAVDRHWCLKAMNKPAQAMFAATGLGASDSLIDALLDNPALAAALENRAEVERLSLTRLRTELAHFGHDPVLERAVARLADRVATQPGTAGDPMPVVIPARYRLGEAVLSFFTTITQFGATGDIAMSELRIEMFFPADDATRHAVQVLWGTATPGD
ncbi:helix-turn-helix transcriptional regulator [Ruegeria pomeroyi]|uniref:Helix-turn-helix transcriptional regulator n=1 Tax=Ruegeria alba TaxID=2916756 RepID=A0ABS9NSP3_9RHOB|nr:helix-turn-helix transcriptional regulator [Ruegeria alba]MCE8511753.1 helix-turn-helix transcriptional regulator [Ruegeria pomeroyi]MCE8531238.1 helix-turn-helix transcriptional regulator [Ruegeria pomeroyi]MCG6557233.1 helix-turn-helix transcriptional regulator [Ruegeria alba]